MCTNPSIHLDGNGRGRHYERAVQLSEMILVSPINMRSHRLVLLLRGVK